MTINKKKERFKWLSTVDVYDLKNYGEQNRDVP